MPRTIRQIRVEGNIAHVPLTQGYTAIIDADDVPLVANCNWRALITRRRDGSIRAVYAVRADCSGGKPVTVYLHRVILNAPADLQADHIDGDGLNNRRINLRLATHAENSQNRRSIVGSSSQYLGVHWHKATSKWQAGIMIDGVNKYLGLFTDEVEAAKKYDAEALAAFGPFARLNFLPDVVPGWGPY